MLRGAGGKKKKVGSAWNEEELSNTGDSKPSHGVMLRSPPPGTPWSLLRPQREKVHIGLEVGLAQ